MLERQKNSIAFECDACGEVYEGLPGEDLKDAWAAAKVEGWAAHKMGDDWMHFCSECASEGSPAGGA